MYETNQLAVIRTNQNALAWLPILLDDNAESFVQHNGQWFYPETLPGFLRTETFAATRLGPRTKFE